MKTSSITAGELAQRMLGTLTGNADVLLTDVAALDSAQATDVSFLESTKQLKKLAAASPGALFVNAQLASHVQNRVPALIVVPDPHGAFMQAMLLFRPLPEREMTGHSREAWIHPTAELGTGTNIHPGAFIGSHVKIGCNCDVLPGAVIRAGAHLGDDCIIHPHAVLYPGVQLGDRVIVHANAVIGADGFGYRFIQGRFERLPHTGSVIVEDDVEIGAGATIDRGLIGSTVIGTGTKIDNLVMIAHNCRIGKHNAFASQVGFAGSCSTGDYVRCGGQVGVADHIHIGENASLGGKTGVMSDLAGGVTYYGIPAQPEKDALKRQLNIQRIPDLREQVQQLTQQLQELQQRLESLSSSSAASKAA